MIDSPANSVIIMGTGSEIPAPINQTIVEYRMADKHCRTIRYRLHPHTREKARKLFGTANACRVAWNHFVGKLRDDYAFYGRSEPSWYSVGKLYTVWRNHYATWIQDYSANIVKLSLKPIETRYKEFFKGNGGLPKFKAQYDHVPSFPLAKGLFKLTGNSLHIQRIGQVSLEGNNPYPDNPLSGTIKYEAGHWYAYIVHEVQIASEPKALTEVGIDRNAGQITCSDGQRYDLPASDKLEKRKRKYQRMMARRQCGSKKQGIKPSNRYLKAKLLHARTQKKIVQARTNWCHHVSKEIAGKYNVVYLEDLETKNMTKSAKGTAEKPGKNVAQKAGLNREILKSGWGKLEQLLSYKSNVIKVPAPYTSQACSQCGHIDKANRKTQADFHCQACGYRENADVNAAINILASGRGVAVSARGGPVVPVPAKRENEPELGYVK